MWQNLTPNLTGISLACGEFLHKFMVFAISIWPGRKTTALGTWKGKATTNPSVFLWTEPSKRVSRSTTALLVFLAETPYKKYTNLAQSNKSNGRSCCKFIVKPFHPLTFWDTWRPTLWMPGWWRREPLWGSRQVGLEVHLKQDKNSQLQFTVSQWTQRDIKLICETWELTRTCICTGGISRHSRHLQNWRSPSDERRNVFKYVQPV